jgi:cyanophycinase
VWRHALAAVTALFVAGAAPAEDISGVKGALVFAGGELRFDNRGVWERFVQLAGGPGAPVVVVPAAARDPQKGGRAVVENLNRYGARAALVPIAPNWRGVDYRAAARDPAHVEALRRAKGVWFIGGSQRRITQALFAEDGGRTPALAAIWEAYRGGAVLGGSSAGTAIMSRWMFADARDSLGTLRYGLTRGVHVDRGLGFLGDGWFVDQHFLARGRFARALYALHDLGYKYGLGVDEDTAVVHQGGTFEVIGYKGALVLDVSGAETDPALPAFNMRKARLTYLDAGDRMDARTRAVTVGRLKVTDQKIDPKGPDFKPYYRRPAFVPDMLSSGAIYEAMYHALDSTAGVVKGLAFGGDGDRKDLGFEFTVYRGGDTVGWYTARGGHETYTVFNVYVDILPVEMADPLYRPLKPSKARAASPGPGGR